MLQLALPLVAKQKVNVLQKHIKKRNWAYFDLHVKCIKKIVKKRLDKMRLRLSKTEIDRIAEDIARSVVTDVYYVNNYTYIQKSLLLKCANKYINKYLSHYLHEVNFSSLNPYSLRKL